MKLSNYYLPAVCLVVGVAVGMYVNHSITKTSEVKVEESVKRDKDVKTVVTEVVTKEPDGKEVRTVVTQTETKIVTVKDKSSDTKVEMNSDQYNVNLLVGINKDALVVPIYGVSASKKFIGNISLGVFGLTNGTGGVSVGMSF